MARKASRTTFNLVLGSTRAASFESRQHRRSGFTIVELLIVVVVIAILAGVTLVLYNGITQDARIAVLTSDLRNARTQLELDRIEDGSYPENGDHLKRSEGTVLEYSRVGDGYCVTASSTSSGTAFFLDQSSATIVEGTCEEGGGSGTVPLTITSPTSLPTAYLMGDPYSYVVTTNSEVPVTFSISSGSLPPGLSLNPNSGAITGELTGLGQADFTVTATSGDRSISKQFTLTGHPFDSCNNPLPSSAAPTFVGQSLRFQIAITLCGQTSPMTALPAMVALKQTEGGSAFIGSLSNTGYLVTSARPAGEVCNGLSIRYVFGGWISEWIDVPGTGC